MSLSKRLVGGLLFLAILSGCHLPSPKEREQGKIPDQIGATYNNASFFFSSVDPKFIATYAYSSVAVPRYKKLQWKACVSDTRTQGKVVGHHFLISNGKHEIDITTDGNSCLNWTENIPFNYLADEKFVLLNRRVTAKGVQIGSADVSVVVNPWQDIAYLPDTPELKKRAQKELGELDAETAFAGSPDQPKRSLILESIRPNIIQDEISGDEGKYRVDITAYSNFERWRIDGRKLEKLILNTTVGKTNDPYDPPTRKVKADIQLICKIVPAGQGPKAIVIGQIKDAQAAITGEGVLEFTSSMKIKNYCATTGTLLIGISARLEPALPLMGPFQGVFVFGPGQYTIGMAFAVPDPTFIDKFNADRTYSVDEFLTTMDLSYANGTRPPTGEKLKNLSEGAIAKLKTAKIEEGTPELLQPFRLEFDSFSLEPYQYKTPSYAKNITREFKARACLRLGIDQNSLRNVNFDLTKMNGQKISIASQNNGCIEWMDSLDFNYLQNECRFPRKTVHLYAKAYNMNRDVDVIVNPWLSGNSSAPVVLWFSGQDKQMPKEECKQDKSQIFLGYYYQDYYMDRFQFRMDPYMGLSQMRWANLSLQPKLKRPSFSDPRGFEERNLPVGRYLLRYAVVDQHVSDYANAAQLKGHIYTVSRAAVNVRPDGMINDLAAMTVPPDAISSLAGLNQLILELVPLREDAQNALIRDDQLENYVDNDTAIEVTPFAGQLIFQSESGGFRAVPEWGGRSLVNHLETYYKVERQEIDAAIAKLSKKENMAKYTDLELYNLTTDRQKLLADLNNYQVAPMTEMFGTNVDVARIQGWLNGKEMTSSDAAVFCGFIMRKLWTRPIGTRPDSALAVAGTAQTQMAYDLATECYKSAFSLVSTHFADALQTEFKYFVKNPQFTPDKTCTLNRQTGVNNCDERVVPRFMKTSLSVGQDFFLSKDYGAGFSGGAGAEIKNKGTFLGAGTGVEIGAGYSVGSYTVRGNSVDFSRGLNFDVDALKFKVHAEDAERCLSIRINPALFYKKHDFLWVFPMNSVFQRNTKKDLTDEEKSELMSRGILICEGKTLGRPIDFTEEYFFVRPSTGKGLVGDTLSSQYIRDWFVSLRGVQDFLTFRSFLQNSYEAPTNVEPEVQAIQEDYGPVQANFARGSRAMPGVFSTAKPIPLK